MARVDAGKFWSNMQAAVDFRVDIVNGLLKKFGFWLGDNLIAVLSGFIIQYRQAGISRATTRTVVYSSLVVLGLDFILTAIMLGGW